MPDEQVKRRVSRLREKKACPRPHDLWLSDLIISEAEAEAEMVKMKGLLSRVAPSVRRRMGL